MGFFEKLKGFGQDVVRVGKDKSHSSADLWRRRSSYRRSGSRLQRKHGSEADS